jgi:hypothetical protein
MIAVGLAALHTGNVRMGDDARELEELLALSWRPAQ